KRSRCWQIFEQLTRIVGIASKVDQIRVMSRCIAYKLREIRSITNSVLFCYNDLVAIRGELCTERIGQALRVEIISVNKDHCLCRVQCLFGILCAFNPLPLIRRSYPEKVGRYSS